MLEEREFFVRKAIGWVLREVGKTRPNLVTEWLLAPATAPRATRASGVTLREAVKYLPEADREAILRARSSG
jgi:3-methyladenine DNA glycosylase AlkD